MNFITFSLSLLSLINSQSYDVTICGASTSCNNVCASQYDQCAVKSIDCCHRVFGICLFESCTCYCQTATTTTSTTTTTTTTMEPTPNPTPNPTVTPPTEKPTAYVINACAVDGIACDSGYSFEEGLCYSDCPNGFVAELGDSECEEDDCTFFCDEVDRTIVEPDYSNILTSALGITDGFESFFDQTTYGDLIPGFFDCFSDSINAVNWANIDGPISLATELYDGLNQISFTDIKNCVANLTRYLMGESIVIAAEIAPSYSLGSGFGSTYGVAFNITFDNSGSVDKIAAYYYDGGCAFISTSPSIGIDMAFVAYRYLTDISGTAIVYGADVPGLPFQPAIAINDACDVVGVAFSYDLGSQSIDLPISYEISGGYCFASDLIWLGDY